jgi:hypothetical protein
MAKRVKQPPYAVTVGHFLDVSQAYLAIWGRSIPTRGGGIAQAGYVPGLLPRLRHPVQQFQIGGQHVV